MKQSDSNFGELMLKNFTLFIKFIEDIMFYIDGDIVLKRFTNYFHSLLTKNDIVFQNDKRPSKPNQINVCAGFMLIKSNKKMIKFLIPIKFLLKK